MVRRDTSKAEGWGEADPAPVPPARQQRAARPAATETWRALPPLPASRLLVGGRRLLLLPRLVELLGLNEAIVLQQVRYYLEDERQPRLAHGQRWVRAPIGRWQNRDFPFWTTRTIERTFASLVAQGLIIARQLDLVTGDATNSYTIDWTNLAALDQRGSGAEHAGRVSAQREDPAQQWGATPRPALPASTYLDEEDLLPISVRLAELLGLDEAVVLRQIYYWLGDRRRPPVRDGRRWVCPAHVPFWESLAFRSTKTIQRVLQRLERDGLLHSSTAYNASPRDRTKWYTVNFAALDALEDHPDSADARINNPDCRDVASQNVGIEQPTVSGSNRPESRHATAPDVGVERPELAPSLTDVETDRKTLTEKEQQPATSPARFDTTPERVVVLTVQDDDQLNPLAQLLAAGVTSSGVRQLLATFGKERVLRHCAIHAWECAAEPEQPHLTAGRLRRRIEEDWQAPVGYRSPEEIAAVATARDRDSRLRAQQARDRAATVAALQDARQRQLEALGLTAADQAHWARVSRESPPLPTLFAQVLFYGPEAATQTAAQAALIFTARDAWERALAPAQQRARAAVATRLTKTYGRPIDIQFLYYDDVVRLLREGEASGD
jgi:hypothetical protein